VPVLLLDTVQYLKLAWSTTASITNQYVVPSETVKLLSNSTKFSCPTAGVKVFVALAWTRVPEGLLTLLVSMVTVKSPVGLPLELVI